MVKLTLDAASDEELTQKAASLVAGLAAKLAAYDPRLGAVAAFAERLAKSKAARPAPSADPTIAAAGLFFSAEEPLGPPRAEPLEKSPGTLVLPNALPEQAVPPTFEKGSDMGGLGFNVHFGLDTVEAERWERGERLLEDNAKAAYAADHQGPNGTLSTYAQALPPPARLVPYAAEVYLIPSMKTTVPISDPAIRWGAETAVIGGPPTIIPIHIPNELMTNNLPETTQGEQKLMRDTLQHWADIRMSDQKLLLHPTKVHEERLTKSAESTDAETEACLVIPVPLELALQWPPGGRTGEDDSPPHITVLYVGAISNAQAILLPSLVATVLAAQPVFSIDLAPGFDWFTAHSGTGKEIAYKSVTDETDAALRALHLRLKEVLLAAGIPVKHATGFISHSTLAYCATREYAGPIPEGRWTADGVILYVGTTALPLLFGGGSLAPRAGLPA